MIRDDSLPVSKEELDRTYLTEDPWGATRIYEKVVRYEEILDILEGKKFNSIVDLGCGEGQYTSKLKKFSQEIKGIDLSEKAIEKAKSSYPDIEFLNKDLRELNENDLENAELIICLDTIYWFKIEEKLNFLEKIKKHRERNNGYFLVSTRIIPEIDLDRFWKEHDFKTVSEFESLISNYFEIIKSKPVQLFFRKGRETPIFSKFLAFFFRILVKLFNGYHFCVKLAAIVYSFKIGKVLISPLICHQVIFCRRKENLCRQ